MATITTDGPKHAALSPSIRHELASAQLRHHQRALSVRYSILFEDVANASDTFAAIRRHVQHASIASIVGFSEGEREDSMIVDIIAAPEDKDTILTLARELKALHCQREVLVSWVSVSSILV